MVFASAVDGWGFRVGDFAQLYSNKLGINTDILNKTLWGDYYLQSKSKRVFKGAQAKGKKPLFVQFVLDNLWSVYDAVITRNKEKIDKIVSSMNIKLSLRDTRQADPRVHLQSICSQWLPLAQAVLGMAVDCLPSPKQVSIKRIEKLMSSGVQVFDNYPPETKALAESFQSCSSAKDQPAIVYVSKLFSVDFQAFPQNRRQPLTKEEIQQKRELVKKQREEAEHGLRKQDGNADLSVEEKKATDEKTATEITDTDEGGCFLAFARIFSGVVHCGQRLYVLGPKHNPRLVDGAVLPLLDTDSLGALEDDSQEADLDTVRTISVFTVKELYLLMGREVELVTSVPPGNVVGIAGLEKHIIKSGTLSSSPFCPSFSPMSFDASPIVRVAVEPVNPSQMASLVHGLKLLNQADPAVEVLVQETGEHVVVAAGEVHLQHCLDDLRERFARIQIRASEPIVPFRETIIPPPSLDMVNEEIASKKESQVGCKLKLLYNGLEESDLPTDGLVVEQTANKCCSLHVHALPLPTSVSNLLEKSTELLRILASLSSESEQSQSSMNKETIVQLRDLHSKLQELFQSLGSPWDNAVNKIWAFGPRRTGPNILLNNVKNYKRPSIWEPILHKTQNTNRFHFLRDYDSSVVNGFQLATLAGPMCEEPIKGVCFIVEEWSILESALEPFKVTEKGPTHAAFDAQEVLPNVPSSPVVGSPDLPPMCVDLYGPFSGQVISAMKEACRRAFLAQPTRLLAAMYSCEIQATADVLGRLYAVLGRRGGQVLAEEMKEGSPIFVIRSVLPVAESFGFAEEIRKRTSGLASPQLVFSHWEVITEDPYWIPTTEEELAHFGEKADYENQARKYMDGVRRRKGLFIEEKTVEHGEKQRTLSKNK